MLGSIRNLLFGSPLPTAESALQRLTKVQALAVFSSDALSSVAYATEEILLVLVTAGPAALELSLPVACAIALLLITVTASYYQIVHGYPSGGGAYIVAHENLGVWPGLTAAAALLIGYVLTVAVSITADVAAITSAFPGLLPYRVGLSLLAIVLMGWANLRGVRESGTLFAIPTYVFVVILLGLILVGIARLAAGTLEPAPVQAARVAGDIIQPLMLFLVLRAFASGCTALTGVEAISNGIPAFCKPEARNAGRTLIAMGALLAVMFLGISLLARSLNIAPVDHETVVSQIGRRVFGSEPLYLALQAATALILVVAANTSFAGFPRLAAILAHDRFLPRQLTNLGDRLVFTNGILTLAVLASVLVAIFAGQTHQLIPLYAIGVFLAFTLAQAGMVRYWRRAGGRGWQWKAAINGAGAVATGVVVTIVAGTKFIHGAWMVTVLIPLFVWAFHAIQRHYLAVARQLSLDGLRPETWTGLSSHKRHKVVVPVSGMHRGTLAALRFARTMSEDVTAVVVDVEPEVTARVQDKWLAWAHGVPLVVLESPYRSTVGPLLAYLDEVDRRDPERGTAVVVLPQLMLARWWHHLLHNQTALLIRTVLTDGRALAGTSRVIVDVPYYLTH